MSSSIKVNILGEEFPVKVNTDQEEEYIREVIKHVIEKMEEAKTITKENSTKRIAVLAALNITAEFLKTDRSYKENIDDISSLLDNIDI